MPHAGDHVTKIVNVVESKPGRGLIVFDDIKDIDKLMKVKAVQNVFTAGTRNHITGVIIMHNCGNGTSFSNEVFNNARMLFLGGSYTPPPNSWLKQKRLMATAEQGAKGTELSVAMEQAKTKGKFIAFALADNVCQKIKPRKDGNLGKYPGKANDLMLVRNFCKPRQDINLRFPDKIVAVESPFDDDDMSDDDEEGESVDSDYNDLAAVDAEAMDGDEEPRAVERAAGKAETGDDAAAESDEGKKDRKGKRKQKRKREDVVGQEEKESMKSKKSKKKKTGKKSKKNRKGKGKAKQDDDAKSTLTLDTNDSLRQGFGSNYAHMPKTPGFTENIRKMKIDRLLELYKKRDDGDSNLSQQQFKELQQHIAKVQWEVGNYAVNHVDEETEVLNNWEELQSDAEEQACDQKKLAERKLSHRNDAAQYLTDRGLARGQAESCVDKYLKDFKDKCPKQPTQKRSAKKSRSKK